MYVLDSEFLQGYVGESSQAQHIKGELSAVETGSGPRYTKPGLQAEKKRAHHKYKKNIAMTDCLVILYPA